MRKTEEKVKSRPILMNTDMVRAVLSGQKIQTRRPVKLNDSGRPSLGGKNWHIDDPNCVKASPFGQAGDRLWVRETWSCISSKVRPGACVTYRADTTDGEKVRCDAPWRPSIHMPRWASRITLEITDVRVERVQHISAEAVTREGVWSPGLEMWGSRWWYGAPQEAIDDARINFADLWDSIYAKRGLGWSENPWVWAVTFRRVE